MDVTWNLDWSADGDDSEFSAIVKLRPNRFFNSQLVKKSINQYKNCIESESLGAICVKAAFAIPGGARSVLI